MISNNITEENSLTAIVGKDNLLSHMNEIAVSKIIRKAAKHREYNERIRGHTFENYSFPKEFQSFLFEKCKFINCRFENIWGFFLYFKKCQFVKCDFRNSRFSHGQFGWTELSFHDCTFRNVEIDEGDLDNTIFEKCFMQGLAFIGEDSFNVHFLNCYIENSQFQSIVYYPEKSVIDEQAEDVVFSDCEIAGSYFTTSDFRNSTFYDCKLYLCAFIDCVLSNDTILAEKKNLAPNYASMDFQTILKSDITDPIVLKNYFNVHVGDLKERILEMSKKINFKKVFISYSFKDREFAKVLNELLNKNDVKTFLWEKDAPPGEYLTDIMSSGVREHETVLFIASENSIRSKACQFELSEARRKQEETWKNVFFPIHIDNYLFEVKKSQIRPIEDATEIWKNIEEIRRVNSHDFTAFAILNSSNKKEFEEAIVKNIIPYLKHR